MGRNTFILTFFGFLIFIAILIPSKQRKSISISPTKIGDSSEPPQPLLPTHGKHQFDWSAAPIRCRVCEVDFQKEPRTDAYQHQSVIPNSAYLNDYYLTYKTKQIHP